MLTLVSLWSCEGLITSMLSILSWALRSNNQLNFPRTLKLRNFFMSKVEDCKKEEAHLEVGEAGRRAASSWGVWSLDRPSPTYVFSHRLPNSDILGSTCVRNCRIRQPGRRILLFYRTFKLLVSWFSNLLTRVHSLFLKWVREQGGSLAPWE